VHWLVHSTRAYLPHLRIIKATSGMHGRSYLVSPRRAVIVYDGNAPLERRHAYVAKAIHQLWKARYMAGLDEYDQGPYPRLTAVS
jgi:hypothetical protein